ncbi:zeta toxin family protein [soil metagenome]
MSAKSRIVILAGPNGAGKSTVAPFLLRDELGVMEFVNADAIAAGLSAYNVEGAAISAGRIMLARLKTLAAEKKDFAFETTLASRSFLPWLTELVHSKSYELRLHFLWLPLKSIAHERVKGRTLLGGHSIPPETIDRRYAAGIANFPRYSAIATGWTLYDSSCWLPEQIAGSSGQTGLAIADELRWGEFQKAPS